MRGKERDLREREGKEKAEITQRKKAVIWEKLRERERHGKRSPTAFREERLEIIPSPMAYREEK